MLRPIQPTICQQYVTEQSPAMVLTVVQLCFLPPFKYVVIMHDNDSVRHVSEPMDKEDMEAMYNFKLSNYDGTAIQGTPKVVPMQIEHRNATI